MCARVRAHLHGKKLSVIRLPWSWLPEEPLNGRFVGRDQLLVHPPAPQATVSWNKPRLPTRLWPEQQGALSVHAPEPGVGFPVNVAVSLLQPLGPHAAHRGPVPAWLLPDARMGRSI